MWGGGGDNICNIPGKKIGINFIHSVEARICVCKACGFIYTTPSLEQKEWDAYYADMYPGYNSHEDYSIENRMDLIKKYASDGDRILELGGNEQGRFSERLRTVFDKYFSYDTNQNCHNNLKSLENPLRVEIMVSYYVFEHIVDINQFLDKCTDMIVDNGIFIVEVPDANIYYREVAGLKLHEHVNHFTPQSLSMLMNKHGFICLEVSRRFASRNFGFVGVYRKQDAADQRLDPYRMNKSLIEDGLYKVKIREANLTESVDYLHKMDGKENLKNTLFWCANDVLSMIINNYEEKFGSFEATIIDEDIRKKDYYGGKYIVSTSEHTLAKHRRHFKNVVICSYQRKESICETLREYGMKDAAIIVVGEDMELNTI